MHKDQLCLSVTFFTELPDLWTTTLSECARFGAPLGGAASSSSKVVKIDSANFA
jgi:hypothetical protein